MNGEAAYCSTRDEVKAGITVNILYYLSCTVRVIVVYSKRVFSLFVLHTRIPIVIERILQIFNFFFLHKPLKKIIRTNLKSKKKKKCWESRSIVKSKRNSNLFFKIFIASLGRSARWKYETLNFVMIRVQDEEKKIPVSNLLNVENIISYRH